MSKVKTSTINEFLEEQEEMKEEEHEKTKILENPRLISYFN